MVQADRGGSLLAMLVIRERVFVRAAGDAWSLFRGEASFEHFGSIFLRPASPESQPLGFGT